MTAILAHAVVGKWSLVLTAGVEAQQAAQLVADDCASDADDIRASLGGDGEAYARLIGRYQQQIAARMRWFSRQPAEAEEMVQDVFVEAYLSLRGFRGQAPFAHWLHKIATRVGYRHWKLQARQRRRGMSRLDDHIDGLGALDGNGDAAAAGELVHSLLARLGPRDRLVLTLLYLEGYSVAEAALLAGWSVPMIKVQAFRAGETETHVSRGGCMTTWEKFERLAAIARREPVPALDVRVAVLRSLSRRSEVAVAAVDPLVIVCAAVSVAAAVVAVALLLPGWDTVGDTLVTCLNPLTLVLQ